MEKYLPKFSEIQTALAAHQNLSASSDFDLNPSQPKLDPKAQINAAVLIPIIENTDGLHVIFTRRSPMMRKHPGQISFPGGKQDQSDTDIIHTALREANEEIGLVQTEVKILGHLPQHHTVTSFLVHPIVGVVPSNFLPKIMTTEVSEVFTVPLDYLLDPQNYLIEGRMWLGSKRHYFTIPYGPYYIWGATARMLRMFTELMGKSHEN